MHKSLVSITIAASIAGAAGGLAFAPGLAGAQDADPDETSASAPTESSDEKTRLEHVRESLDDLVIEGTISSTQADAVAEHLVDNARFRRGPTDHERPRHRHRAHGSIEDHVEALFARIDNAVENEKITEERAASIKANIAERARSAS